MTCETFDDAQPYRPEQTPASVLREARGVRQTFEISSERAKIGPRSAVWSVKNSGDHGGWASVARRFATPVNLAGSQALALWVHGDGGGEQLRIQLSDSAGRAATWLVPIGFHGWRLCTYRLADAPKLDWSKIDGLQFWVQSLRVGMSAQVGLDDLRALPEVHTAGPLVAPTIEINGQRLSLAKSLTTGQGLSADEFDGVQLWTGGMKPGQRLAGDPAEFALQPGENRITFTADPDAAYPGDVTVIVSRLWPLAPGEGAP